MAQPLQTTSAYSHQRSHRHTISHPPNPIDTVDTRVRIFPPQCTNTHLLDCGYMDISAAPKRDGPPSPPSATRASTRPCAMTQNAKRKPRLGRGLVSSSHEPELARAVMRACTHRLLVNPSMQRRVRANTHAEYIQPDMDLVEACKHWAEFFSRNTLEF
ncbi:hypothetical protein G6O67_008411 [Ophiocordyceps sinensis]|uniref:Uncharacterized protein n=1 Tax=Ophiocordyceps sinensis TaxID=72228 RepID=A0A8H4PMY8_9HYPO|nr:hypothetical protein G6O67_008411 [Ophiocordyceps sinensis]